MSFLYPGFLFALFAVSIPVIIHLFNFRKLKKIYFSNVRFLKSIEQQTSASQKIKHRLILLCRILAIAFLVLAFSKPFIRNKDTIAAGQTQIISIYLDNSYSMEALNKEGTLLDEAKRRAKEIVAAYGLNDKFQLLTNDFEGRHQRLLNREDFIEAVDEVNISGVSRNLERIIQRQSDIFANEPKATKNIYLISDFQKNLLPKARFNIDSAARIRLVQLQANALANVSVDSVWFASPVHRLGDSEKLIVRLKNNSDEDAKSIPVKLTINNQQKALGSLNIEARGTSSDTLSFTTAQSGWQQGKITIADNPIIFDDQFYFSFKVSDRLPVLVINEKEPNPYLQAVYHSEPFFSVANTTVGNVNYGSLSTYSLVILNTTNEISSGLGRSLADYAKNGGTLMIFPSLNENLTSFREFARTLGTDLPEGIKTGNEKVTAINLQHQLFDRVFERIPRSLDLPVAKSYIQYRNLSRVSKKNILDFGNRQIFFAEYKSGNGKIYLSAVPLDEEASNLVKHSVFVPLMYQTALHSLKNQRLFYTVGRDELFEIEKTVLNANQTLNLQNLGFEAIPEIRQTASGTQLYVADQLRESGNYQLMKGDSLLAVLAFNDDRTESDLSYATVDELENQFAGSKPEVFNPQLDSVQNAIQSANFGIQLWKLCLILALVFLAAEILLIRFYRNIQSSKKLHEHVSS